MIVKAMNWIEDHVAPNIHEINGEHWTDKHLTAIKNVKSIDKVELHTLTSLVDYLKSGIDVPNDFVNHVFINIVSPSHIVVYSEAGKDNHYARTDIAEVTAQLPKINIGDWLSQTQFCIMLRANFIDNTYYDDDVKFVHSTNRDALISAASNIVSGTIQQYEDTGISQKATFKTGIQETEDKLLPEKVVLCPYRTFMEVEQPVSEFIFRADDGRDGVRLALYEADGGKWKIDAMASIKAYLAEQLADLAYITILA